MRLLLVEDHDDTRRAMEMLLRIANHAVVAVGTAADAVAAATEADEGFDCALVDLNLPDASGLDLFRDLRSIRPIRGIALTGDTSADDAARCAEAGFHLHLPKPVSFDLLEQALNRLNEA